MHVNCNYDIMIVPVFHLRRNQGEHIPFSVHCVYGPCSHTHCSSWSGCRVDLIVAGLRVIILSEKTLR